MPGIYFGWHMVITSVLVYMLLIGSTISAFGVFVVPVSTEFGLSRANMNSALILLNLGNAIVAPFVGRALDRLPMRLIMAGSAMLLGGSLIGLGLSHLLWLSAFIMFLPLAIAQQGAGTLTVTVLIARWFLAQRGRAMALAAIGMSLGGIVITPIIAWSITWQGWRATLVTAGIALTVIMLLISLIVRERPGAGDREPPLKGDAAARQAAKIAHVPTTPQSAGTLLRQAQFWTLAIGAALTLGITQSLQVSLVPLGIDGGLSMVQATFLLSISGTAAILGKLTLATFADRVDRLLLLAGLFILLAGVNVLLLVEHSYAILMTSAFLFGLTVGAIAPIFYAALADRFGAASFGTARGLTTPIIAIFSAVTVRYAGEVFDRTGNYELLFITFIGALILAAALMVLTSRFAARDMAAYAARAGA